VLPLLLLMAAVTYCLVARSEDGFLALVEVKQVLATVVYQPAVPERIRPERTVAQ